jgi:hypothetical protein
MMQRKTATAQASLFHVTAKENFSSAARNAQDSHGHLHNAEGL